MPQPDTTPLDDLLARLPGEFPNLEFLARATQGGMGMVFHVHQTTLDRPAALKVLMPAGDAEKVDYGPFFAEVRSLAKLSCPGIVGIYDAGQTVGGTLYMLLEWMPGGNLRKLGEGGPLPAAKVSALAASLAVTLGQAHESNIVHGDIKPDNIMLDEAGEPHLGDFGVANLIGKRARFHTPEYAAPELLGPEPRLTPQTDLYALGVTLAELLLHRLPARDVELARQLSTVPQPLKSVLLGLLHPTPSKRISEASEVTSLLAGNPPTQQPSRPARRDQTLDIPVVQSSLAKAPLVKHPAKSIQKWAPMAAGLGVLILGIIWWPRKTITTPLKVDQTFSTTVDADMDAVFSEMTEKPEEVQKSETEGSRPPLEVPVVLQPTTPKLELPPPAPTNPVVSIPPAIQPVQAPTIGGKDPRRGWHPGVEGLVEKYNLALYKLPSSTSLTAEIKQEQALLMAGGLPAPTADGSPEIKNLRNLLLAAVDKALREDCRLLPANLSRNAVFRNGRWMLIVEELLTWSEASDHALRIGGHLARVKTAVEMTDLLGSLPGTTNVWLGGSDAAKEGNWRWVTGEPMRESLWRKGEPNNANGDELYLELLTGFGFNDIGDQAKFRSVVEWNPLVWHLKATTANSGGPTFIVDGGRAMRTGTLEFKLPTTAAFIKTRLASANLIMKVGAGRLENSSATFNVSQEGRLLGQLAGCGAGRQVWIPLITTAIEPVGGRIVMKIFTQASDGSSFESASSQSPPVLLLQFSQPPASPPSSFVKIPPKQPNLPKRCTKCDGFGNALARARNGISKKVACKHCGGDGKLP